MVPKTSPSKKICSFHSCAREVVAKEMCHAHYKQQAIGKPLSPLSKRSLTLQERFDQKCSEVTVAGNGKGQKPQQDMGASTSTEKPVRHIGCRTSWPKGKYQRGCK